MNTTNLNKIAADFVQAYKDQLTADGKVASGSLVNSISYTIRMQGTFLEVSLNLEEYWKYVELGRRPGSFPPVDKIKEWIRVKPILPRPMANGKLPTENQLAFMIGGAIAKRGIKGTKSLSRTIRSFSLEDKIVKEVQDQLSIEVDNAIKNVYK